ncbi:Hypothetical_protein [Hexamita inflata]|uniref:Hypothetical_protein n=1 Tax=Hexamita inflata TaxID=28002 RepID=A0AA86R3G0_9EUKA|nr:Hypothetical protein HINF_LOCUS58669 [Hexamita inflata]
MLQKQIINQFFISSTLKIYAENLQRNSTNLQGIITLQGNQLNQLITNVNQSLQQHIDNTTLLFNNVQINIQKVNNSLTQQLQQSSVQLLDTITAVNTTLKQHIEAQKQQLQATNQNMQNLNSAQTATINSVNSNLQNQIDGTKNDVRNVQSSIAGLNGQINNINQVNSVQSDDIQALKSQTGSNMNGAVWCGMYKTTQPSGSNFLKIQGYCSSSKLCCWNHPNYGHLKLCMVQIAIIDVYTNDQCGTFVYI